MKKSKILKVIALIVLFIGISTLIVGCSAKEEKASDDKEAIEIANKKSIEDYDNNGKISIGDRVTLDTESFYVINVDKKSEEVKLLAEWNLNVGKNIVKGTEGVQNSLCKGVKCLVSFSETEYWDKNSFVYNEQSNLYTYIENYSTYLKDKGYSSVKASLVSFEEIMPILCDTKGNGSCDKIPLWLKTGSFWSGTATGSDIYLISSGRISSFAYSKENGVRPVVTISVSEIK